MILLDTNVVSEVMKTRPAVEKDIHKIIRACFPMRDISLGWAASLFESLIAVELYVKAVERSQMIRNWAHRSLG